MRVTPPREHLDYRPSYLAAAIVTALVFALYVVTLGPSTAMWDTSEYIAAAYIMGLPHPPGNPFFVLLGRFFTLLPIHGDIAGRVNLLAALTGALSAGLWFLVTERVLASWSPRRWQRIVGGTLAAIIGGTAFTVWNQSVVNEKVYTVSLVGIALIAWLTIRWSDEPDGRGADRTLVLIAYLLGLGYSNHMAGALAAPAVALAIVLRRPKTFVRWRLLLAGGSAALLGLSPFATQPLRAAHFPAINEGEPTGCRTSIGLECTLSTKTWTAFKYNFDRVQYGKPDLAERQAPFTAQVGMWWVYFQWQWLRDAYGDLPATQAALAAIFLMLGALGAWAHWRKDRLTFWFFGSLMVTITLVLIFYLNFKYGYSQSPTLDVDREVRDRDYFFIWSFSAWSVWAALGLVYVWETIASIIGAERVRLGSATLELPRTRSLAFASPVLGLALVPLFGNWRAATHAGDTTTRDFAADLLNSVEPYGMIVTAGDNDTFPLWYAQQVEGIRPDVVILCESLLNTDWYPRQLVRAPVREYDVARGPAIYRGQSWPKPTTPPVQMTLDEVDAIPPYVELREAQQFMAGEVRATISPRILSKSDIFVLRAIKDNIAGGRPVYFSRTTATYGDDMGLTPYLVSQGLARKLLPNAVTPGVDTVMVPGQGYIDVARSRTLWTDVFQGPRSLARKGGWPDRASVTIPFAYIFAGLTLTNALDDQGKGSQAAPILRDTESVIRASHTESLFRITGPATTDSSNDRGPAIPLGPLPPAAPSASPPQQRR